jgi:hypothetical protein
MGTAILALLGAAAFTAMMASASDSQDNARQKTIAALFESMEKGIRESDKAAFKAPWREDAYENNFIGRSGLAGKEVFGQGTRKKWFLKPDLTRALTLGDGAVVLVPCDVWAWEKEKAVDKVDMLLVKEKDAWKILGGGEKRVQVEALAHRWLKKEPLDALKEKE